MLGPVPVTAFVFVAILKLARESTFNSENRYVIYPSKAGAKGELSTPIDMLGPPEEQTYSFEDSGFCA